VHIRGFSVVSCWSLLVSLGKMCSQFHTRGTWDWGLTLGRERANRFKVLIML